MSKATVGNRHNDLVIAILKGEYKKLTADEIAKITTLPVNEVKQTIKSMQSYNRTEATDNKIN